MRVRDCRFMTKTMGEAGTFEGYASVFGNVDQGGDCVEAGAFRDSLARAKAEGKVIPLLWQHDQKEPVGIWTDIAEDSKGLHVRGQLLLEHDPLARRAYGLLKAGAIGGLSIGYTIPWGGGQPEKGSRGSFQRLKEVDLHEISLVTMPMNTEARVTGVKSALAAGKTPTTREFEAYLREAGFAKSLATAIASKAAPLLRGEPGDSTETEAAFLQALLKQHNEKDLVL
ncbi:MULTISPECIES: HK97 family phage prohead protease [unclassified Haematospirillum]|uniref:HK97 family phage prohead protease n=1 Tax=unclassified Haematospirillum TaxID=2622088 RepID=UPI0014390B1D|nr:MULTISPECIES: HK97 family phage prohead protease [unclassified Haematospirillum]NKD55964.1 HK97 family phage prohead protease [Haematospirillum sp. H4890]NKD75271.1 HK97 family phage prohead protease [Haematospirillum sp. H4485]